MDFFILKVNGQDLSEASQEEIIRAFNTAHEPITVEVCRRVSSTRSGPQMSSIATQTESVPAYFNQIFRPPSPPPLSGLEQFETDDLPEENAKIMYEEVVLHRKSENDRIGLTLCYGPKESNGFTEVFISAIEPDSVASKSGKIKEGDIIIQVNKQEVRTRDDVIQLFNECTTDIHLLLCRQGLEMVHRSEENYPSTTNNIGVEHPGNALCLPLIEEELDEVESAVTDTETLPSHKENEGKDSGVGHDSSPSSEHEEDCVRYRSLHSLQHHYGVHHQEQCSRFREDLEARCLEMFVERVEHLDIQTRRPIVANPQEIAVRDSGNRPVPKMGTRAYISDSCMNTIHNAKSSEYDDLHIDTAYNTAESCKSTSHLLEQDKSLYNTICLAEDITAKERLYDTIRRRSHCKSTSSNQRANRTNKSKEVSSATPNMNASSSYDDICNKSDQLAETMIHEHRVLLKDSGSQEQTLEATSEKTLCDTVSDNSLMEWVMKCRADGSRYITRRPIKNKILSERKKKFEDERCGLTTDDDNMSELKLGRYWSKADKKRHLQKARDHRRSKETTKQRIETLKKQDNTKINVIELGNRKLCRRQMIDLDFSSIQEILVHGGRVKGAKFNILSVTTV